MNKTSANYVEATGRVVSINSKTDELAIITIVSKNGQDIYPRFLCKKSIIPQLHDHARVKITGHIESNARKDRTGKRTVNQRFIADSVSLDETMTEDLFGIKGRFFYPPKFDIIIKGRVISITEDKDWYRYTFELDNDNEKYTSVRASMRRLDRHPDLKKGDKICAICALSTPKKPVNDGFVYYEDILVSDIVKVEDNV